MVNNMTISLELKGETQPLVFTDCIDFDFRYKHYSPFTELNIILHVDEFPSKEITSVKFILERAILHYGTVDICEKKTDCKGKTISIYSRGFSYQLTKSQIHKSIMYKANPKRIVMLCPKINNLPIAYQMGICDYININERQTLWSVLTSFYIKFFHKRPFIVFPNSVRAEPMYVCNMKIPYSKVISHSDKEDFSNLVSSITMANISTSLDPFVATSEIAQDHKIGSEKLIPFNYNFQTDPATELTSLLKYLEHNCYSESFTYRGYNGEMPFCKLSIGDTVYTIHSIRIKGNNDGILTTITQYSNIM